MDPFDDDFSAKEGFEICDSPTQQKLFRRLKTKPRGFEEEVLASTGCTSPKEVVLEGSVWGDLPEELVDRVLAWLPPVCLFRLRGVCRKWNSVLNECGFLNLLLSFLPMDLVFSCHRKVVKNGKVLFIAIP